MKIIEDFIPSFYQNSIYETLLNDKINWKFLQSASGAKSPNNLSEINTNQSGFYHLAYNDEKIKSKLFYLVRPMINSLIENHNEDISSIIRIRFGLSTNTVSEGYRNPHTDLKYPHKTLLYYVNDSDGDTVLYNEKFYKNEIDSFSIMKKITPKMGTAIIFDGLQYHSSGVPKKTNTRFTININYV